MFMTTLLNVGLGKDENALPPSRGKTDAEGVR